MKKTNGRKKRQFVHLRDLRYTEKELRKFAKELIELGLFECDHPSLSKLEWHLNHKGRE